MCEKFKESWVKDIKEQPKLRTYCIFKHEFKLEDYLVTIDTFKLRKTLTKFRLSNHMLEIERGRHSRIPVEERYCRVCNCNMFVEDEFHFLMVCSPYKELRGEFIRLMGRSHWRRACRRPLGESEFRVPPPLRQ